MGQNIVFDSGEKPGVFQQRFSGPKKGGQSMVLTTLCSVGTVGRVGRELRVEFSGAIYHVMNRGDRREAIFRGEVGRQCFVATLAEEDVVMEFVRRGYFLFTR
jgi:hypothetical protein